LIDYHIVYAGVLVYLMVKRAGHVFGLDGVAERLRLIEDHPALRPLVG
jgi:thiosulfate dehydrogenase (quinone) large subunit